MDGNILWEWVVVEIIEHKHIPCFLDTAPLDAAPIWISSGLIRLPVCWTPGLS